jgi:hypothetical protein
MNPPSDRHFPGLTADSLDLLDMIQREGSS